MSGFHHETEITTTKVPRGEEIEITFKEEYIKRKKTRPLPEAPNYSNDKRDINLDNGNMRVPSHLIARKQLDEKQNENNYEDKNYRTKKNKNAENSRREEEYVKTKGIDANNRPKEDDVVKINIPKEEDVHLSKNDSQSTNRFAQSKNFIQTIADVSLMMANFSQLRAVLDFNERGQFYISLLTFIIISLLSHLFFVIINVLRTNYNSRHLITVGRASKILKDKKDKMNGNNKKKADGNGNKNTTADNDGNNINTADEDGKKKVRYFLCCTKVERLEEYIDNSLCQCTHCHTNRYLDYICRILVFITICANIGITGIGISE